jgi:hypothetical protein
LKLRKGTGKEQDNRQIGCKSPATLDLLALPKKFKKITGKEQERIGFPHAPAQGPERRLRRTVYCADLVAESDFRTIHKPPQFVP